MSKTELKPFEQAMLDAVLEEFADIPPEEEIDIAFSSKFKENSQEILGVPRSHKKTRLSAGIRRVIFIAAIIAALVVTAVAAPLVREAMIHFSARNEGTHYEFDFDPEAALSAPKYILTAYIPHYIPDGFTRTAANCNIGAVMYDWVAEDRINYVGFYQGTLPINSTGGVDAEDVESGYMQLGAYEVFFVSDDFATTYCWTNHEYYFELTCTEIISQEEMQRIFFSVAIDPNAVIEYLDKIQ